tara:strand:+ start:28848 stop:29192 length:345 start_codon:yes stop_codon:yes gene_type:complete
MIKIYHNPRCSKSREVLYLLQERYSNIDIIKYLEKSLKFIEIFEILKLLKIDALDLVRKNELVWRKKYKGKVMTEQQIIGAMMEYPQLIERPIVIINKKAIIARPPEKVLILFN